MLRLREPLLLAIVSLSAIAPTGAFASKFSVSAGAYDITAETTRSDGSVRNLGVYQLSFRFPVVRQLELGVGYSVAMSGIVGGDLAFGVDIGLHYYPLTSAEGITWSSDSASFQMSELWRPYVGLGFHQRQVQAIQTSYAGFGLSLGVERVLREMLSARGEVRALQMSGTASSSAREFDVLLGLVIGF